MDGSMRIALLIPLLAAATFGQVSNAKVNEDSLVSVISFKYSAAVKEGKEVKDTGNAPASALTPEDKYFRRTARQMDAPGAIQPKDYTIDGRSAALEKAVSDSRTQKPVRTEGFSYQLKIKNEHTEKIEVIFWEFQLKDAANSANIKSRQFLCGINVGAGKEIEITTFSTLGLSNVVEAKDADGSSKDRTVENVQINRVEYANGFILQRKEWDYKSVKPDIDRVLSTQWDRESCRMLR